jgi:hypothetical protein
MAIEFLALPEEQRPWLKHILEEEGVWCWVRMSSASSVIITSPNAVDEIDFETEKLVELDFGRDGVMKPVFTDTVSGIALDFPRSLAVQFIPSLILDDHLLTVGQLAISSKGWYEFYGVSPDPLLEWYRGLARSWKRAFDEKRMVVVNGSRGRVTEYRCVHLTHGAVDWWKQGNRLKDPTNMTFEYDVVPRTPRKRPSP